MHDETEFVLEWDESKRQKALKERDVDFKLARFVLTDPNLVRRIDDKRNYKETRYLAYGMVYGRVFKLSYIMYGTTYKVLSLYKLHEKNQEQYYGKIGQDEREDN